MPDPCAFDSEAEFHSACMAERREEHPDEDQAQSNAICHSMWRERDCDKTMTPTREAPTGPIHKQGQALSVGDREAIFVASTETPDRHGDIVRQDWVTQAFMKNPVFLLQHQSSSFPIGKVKRWWTEGKKSFAYVEALPEGMDDLADKAWKFIKAGFLRAVSVGFLPTEEPKMRKDKDDYFLGWEYPKSELLELSLVSVPANAEALAVAKSLDLSQQDVEQIFEKPKGMSAGARNAKRFVEVQRLRASTL